MTSNIDELVHRFIDVGCHIKTLKGLDFMNALGRLEQMLIKGEITEEEYRKRKAVYVETILEMYIKGIIDERELYEKLNQ